MEDEQKEEVKPKPKPKPKPVMLPVKVLGRKGPSVLVQWMDGETYHRGYLPAGKIGDEVDKKELAKAVPYGLPWENYIVLKELTPESIANQLRKRGVWTYEDLNIKVLQRVSKGFDIGKFLAMAGKEAKK